MNLTPLEQALMPAGPTTDETTDALGFVLDKPALEVGVFLHIPFLFFFFFVDYTASGYDASCSSWSLLLRAVSALWRPILWLRGDYDIDYVRRSLFRSLCRNVSCRNVRERRTQIRIVFDVFVRYERWAYPLSIPISIGNQGRSTLIDRACRIENISTNSPRGKKIVWNKDDFNYWFTNKSSQRYVQYIRAA